MNTKDDDDLDLDFIEIDGDNGKAPEGKEPDAGGLEDDSQDDDAGEDGAGGRGDGEDDEDGQPRRKNRMSARERVQQAVKRQRETERALEAERVRARDLEARLQQTQTYAVKQSTAAIERQVADIKAQLKQAIEDGDTDKQIDLNAQLVDTLSDLKIAKQRGERMEAEAAATKKPAGDDEYKGPINEAPDEHKEKVYSNMPKRAAKWAREHEMLSQDPEVIGIIVSVDAAVADAGFDRNSDEYYQELDKRLKRRVPELYEGKGDADNEDEDEPAPRRRVSSAVAAPGTRTAPARRDGRQTKLSPDQVANMRRFNLDPANPKHREAYIKNNS